MVATFIIGLREGLEMSLVIGILLAHLRRTGRSYAAPKIWWGVGSAVVVSFIAGAILTFGRYSLSFKAQEIIGGTMSILAVVMITSMVFWMMSHGATLQRDLEESVDKSVAKTATTAAGWGIFWLAFVTVAREGLETTIIILSWSSAAQAFIGAILGILIAAVLGVLLNRGMVRINLSVFFMWTGGLLIILAAGILAYGIHDLQEAAVLPGPFSGAPITPTDPLTGAVLVGFASSPFWLAAYPFGWAWDLSSSIAPDGFFAALAKGTVGWTPQMTWLEVTIWFLFITVALTAFLFKVRAQLKERRAVPAKKPVPVSTNTIVKIKELQA
ncbi:iron uptake transporter permease EfeU [Corynebacterium lubricantis]|uniref:iron uptake transporter permease EfeU n=1 Tax=Corynebacterium lubricantis TaxID=541095 RepID=UPI001B7FDEC8|nr:iron uptake transporter permease EfeU [Corynebacterium lubricantis]